MFLMFETGTDLLLRLKIIITLYIHSSHNMFAFFSFSFGQSIENLTLKQLKGCTLRRRKDIDGEDIDKTVKCVRLSMLLLRV